MYHQSRFDRGDRGDKSKGQENTTESGYGEMIYMEPTNNQMMSPVTEGRQTMNRGSGSGSRGSPEGMTGSRSIISAVRVDLKERRDTAELIGEKPISSLVVPIPSRGSEERIERSPKTINIGETKEQTEYNIRTLNARRSPKGGRYQTFTNVQDQVNLGLDQPMQYGSFMQQGDGSGYEMGNNSGVMISSLGGKQSPGLHAANSKEATYIMNPREGMEPLNNMSKMSPKQNIDDINSSGEKGYDNQTQLNSFKNTLGNNNMRVVSGTYVNDVTAVKDMLNTRKDRSVDNKYNNMTYNNMTYGDVKKLVRRFTKVYDPKKTKEGNLISESQVIVPGANDDVFNSRYKVLQKMNRLSNILLSKKRDTFVPTKETLNASFNDDSRKTFNRHTLMKNTLKNNRMSLSRSPEHKFLYVSLAMISSKGPTAEDRLILRKMRLDRGGVVDLAQEERKKGKYTIKKITQRGAKGVKGVYRTNPKYREQAAKLIQQWWRELKELYKERLNQIIKIQSFWRGRWVRKYMYDILYLSFMYQSFCQIIQKVLVKHVRPLVFQMLRGPLDNQRDILRRLFLKDSRWKMIRIYPYLKKWIDYMRSLNLISSKGRNLFDIRNASEMRKITLKKYFDKWVYLSKIHHISDQTFDAEREKNKFMGLLKIFEGTQKFTKRVGLKNLEPNVKEYLKSVGLKKKLNDIVRNYSNTNNRILRKYFNKWRNKIFISSKDTTGLKENFFISSIRKIIETNKKDKLRSAFNNIYRVGGFAQPEPEVEIKTIVKEKTKIVKNYEFAKACELLKRATWRITYLDPYNALMSTIERNSIHLSLTDILRIREKTPKLILNRYFNKWRSNIFEKKVEVVEDTSKYSIYVKLLDVISRKFLINLLKKKLNQWRRKIVKKQDNNFAYDQNKSLESITKIIKKNSFETYGDDFLDKLKHIKNPELVKRFLRKLLNILEQKNNLNSDKNLNRVLKNWLLQAKNLSKNDLEKKLYLKICKNLYDRKLKDSLREYFNKWKGKAPQQVKKVDNSQKVFNQFRKIATKPIFKHFKKLLNKDNRDKQFESLLNRVFRQINTKLLRDLINKWKKQTLQTQKKTNDNEIKNLFLKNLVNFNDRKSIDNLRNRLHQILLKWRINTAPKKNFDNIVNTRKGYEKLVDILKNIFKKEIFDNVKDTSTNRGKVKLLTNILLKTNPRLAKKILDKYLRRWLKKKEDVKVDDDKLNNKLNKFLNEYVRSSSIRERQFEPYKQLVSLLKDIFKVKKDKGKTISDFTKNILKTGDKIRKGTITKILTKLLSKSHDLQILRVYFRKFRRQVRLIKADEDADIIQEFCQRNLKKILQKRKVQQNGLDLLRRYILRKALEFILKNTKGNNIYTLLRKIIKFNENSSKKNLKKYLDIWKNKALKGRRDKAATEIQSVWRGFNVRNKRNKKESASVLFRNAILRKIGIEQDNRKIYLNKWNKIAQYLKCLNNARIIQKFCKKHFKNLSKLRKLFDKNDDQKKLSYILRKWNRIVQKLILDENADIIQVFCQAKYKKTRNKKNSSREDVYNLFKKYYMKKIGEILNETYKNYYQPFKEILEQTKGINKRYAINDLLYFGSNKLKIKLLKKLIEGLNGRNLLNLQRIYFDKFRTNTTNFNKHITTIQKVFRGHLGRIKYNKFKNLFDLLLNIFMRKNRINHEALYTNFRKWNLRNKLMNCIDSAEIIQEFIVPRLNKKLHLKIVNFFDTLAKGIIEKKLNKAMKFWILKKTLLRILFRNLKKDTFETDKKKKINKHVKFLLNNLGEKNNKNKLIDILKKWLKKTLSLKDDENNKVKTIQNAFRTKLSKDLLRRLRDRFNKLKKLIIMRDNNSKTNYYFNKWRRIVKLLTLLENADIIQKFCKNGMTKLNKKRLVEKNKFFKNGLDKLLKIKFNTKYGLDKLKNNKKKVKFDDFLNKLGNKRSNLTKLFFNKLLNYIKNKKLSKLPNIYDKIRKDILKKYLKKWKDQNDKLARLRGAEMIQKNFRIFKNNKKNSKLLDNLKNIINKYSNKNVGKKTSALKKWRKKAYLLKTKEMGDKLAKFVERKYKNKHARDNWKKLFRLLYTKNHNKNISDLLKKLKQFIKTKEMINLLKKKFKKNGLDQLFDKLKYINLLKTTRKNVLLMNDKNNNKLLDKYLKKLKNIIDKLKERDEAIKKMIDTIQQRKYIEGLRIINAANILKKFLHDYPKIRALDFFKRLKNFTELKRKFNTLSSILLKVKDDLNEKNKEKFYNKTKKNYVYDALEKLLNQIKKLQNKHKLTHIEHLLKLLKVNQLKRLEYSYTNQNEGNGRANKLKLTFKAHLSPKSISINDDKKVYQTLIPFLIDWIKNRITVRRAWALDRLINSDRNSKFCRLYKEYSNQKQLKPKRDLYNTLLKRYRDYTTHGKLNAMLFCLLRKYFIRYLCRELVDPSRMYKLLYLFKLTFMHKGIAEQRFIREIVRKWRFISFVKKMSRRKLELMYKNMHVSYLQMVNEVFGEEEMTSNPSVIKEFERFGSEIGMWVNEDPTTLIESGFCKGINKKYIFEPIEIERMEGYSSANEEEVVIEETTKIVKSGYKTGTNKSNISGREDTKSAGKKRKVEEKEKETEINTSGAGLRGRRSRDVKVSEEKSEKKEVPVTSERRGGRRRYETGTSNTVAAEKVIPVTDSTPKKGGRSRYSNKTYGNDSEKKKEEENQTGTFKPRRTRDNK